MKQVTAFIIFLSIAVFTGTHASAAGDFSALNSANYEIAKMKEKMSREKVDPKLMTQAKDLEAVLISQMIEPMFPDGEESGLFGGGDGNSIYRSMMIQEYGKMMSNSGGIGLAKNIAKNLSNKHGGTK